MLRGFISPFCTALAWACVCATASAAPLTLVEDGRATSIIVTNDHPTAGQALAAAELQTHLRIMTGATLPVVKEKKFKQGSAQTGILVGQTGRSAR